MNRFPVPPLPNTANACTSTGVSSFPTPVLSMYDGFSLPQSTWIALLSIAHPYEFLNVRVRAIREIYDPLRQWEEENSSSGSSSDSDSDSHLEPPDHLMLILTVGKYDMPLQKVLPSIVELVMREESLTEVEIVGLSTLAVYRLARARGVFTQDYERGVLGLP